MNISLNEITNIVGADSVKTSVDILHKYSFNQIVPKAVVFPKTDEQISEIVNICNSEKITISPLGGRTKRFIGNIPTGIDIIISTKHLNKVIEHIADDMIAVTQSGILIKKLQSILKQYNQFLALDPPHIESGCTIGGIIATNDYGPLRQRYSSIKENILEIKFVRPDGKIVHSGAKVVKNVAGYDIHKLMVGSYGTLGIITETTLRLYPIPESSKTIIIKFSSLHGIGEVIHKLLNSDFIYSSFEISNVNCLSDASPYFIALKIDNVINAVEDQVRQVKDYFSRTGFKNIDILSNQTEIKFWRSISNFPFNLNNNKLLLKIRIPVSSVIDIVMYFEQLSKSSDTVIKITGSLGIGIINVTLENSDEILLEQYLQILNKITLSNGYVSIIQSPKTIKDRYDVFGRVNDGTLNIMRDIKARFDPKHIMNPGIFIGRI